MCEHITSQYSVWDGIRDLRRPLSVGKTWLWKTLTIWRECLHDFLVFPFSPAPYSIFAVIRFLLKDLGSMLYLYLEVYLLILSEFEYFQQGQTTISSSRFFYAHFQSSSLSQMYQKRVFYDNFGKIKPADMGNFSIAISRCNRTPQSVDCKVHRTCFLSSTELLKFWRWWSARLVISFTSCMATSLFPSIWSSQPSQAPHCHSPHGSWHHNGPCKWSLGTPIWPRMTMNPT